ncbi:MAG: helix-turn-helix transcriptional regulator [Nitrosomonas sp.]|nr:helix-turn-helix transcriptional regulator [Nitrosomonas sp.]MCW5608976.1 helix-turn-helix transcriptional regulator [Nitrosomonas sp.]
MDMKSYIEMGEKKAGKQAELAKILGISENYIRVTKTGKNGLPDAICFKLAEYIGVDVGSVIAVSNLVTEKKEERRKIYESYLKRTNQVACIGLIVFASLILSPSPAYAAGLKSVENDHIYIMLYYGARLQNCCALSAIYFKALFSVPVSQVSQVST